MSKVAALLNMLSSDNDGERVNAARLLTTIAKKENKTIADLVMSPQVIYRDRVVEPGYGRTRGNSEPNWKRPDPPPRKPKMDEDDLRNYRPKDDRHFEERGPKRKARGATEILDELRWCRDYPEHLNGFESEFVDDILMKCSYDYDLSARQEATAKKIIRKVKARENDEPLV